ncbi:hypothetical protein [Streptomyces sp. NPDC059009]|uniref:hypothetical protein n=1 Tax=Streptomyces sp. NPDC059009 TaxID=3346694 RepID=UPI0036BA91DD
MAKADPMPDSHKVTYLPDEWHYPDVLDDDLKDSGLAPPEAAEVISTSWEYCRCSIPVFTNWDRFLAFVRLTVIYTVAEYRGDLTDDVLEGRPLLGYDADGLLRTLFEDTPVLEEMSREFWTFMIIASEKTRGDRRGSLLFRRLVEATAHSPADFLRLRDADAQVRLYLAATLACNDVTDPDAYCGEEQNRALNELTISRYDTVGYFKHRAEAELFDPYFYTGPEIRQEYYHKLRQALWALDTNWGRTANGRYMLAYMRIMGGPIHLEMRRYRFVQDGLVLGRTETDSVVEETRRNFKLWYRIDAPDAGQPQPADVERYEAIMAQEERLLFPGLAAMLNRPDEEKCPRCVRRHAYGAQSIGEVAGVQLCDDCRAVWRAYFLDVPRRVAAALPLAGAKPDRPTTAAARESAPTPG